MRLGKTVSIGVAMGQPLATGATPGTALARPVQSVHPSQPFMDTQEGVDEPKPHATFESMDLTPEVRRAISDELQYKAPTEVQAASFGPIRNKRDVVVQSRTGTGKTAAFGIPIADMIDPLERVPQLLVLAPTRELANQVASELEKINRFRGNRVLAIYGGSAFGPQLEGLKAGAQIIAGTPGRVLDHLRRGTLKLDNLRFFILDEADEMLSMGFQDELESILEFVPKERQTLLFSATFPGEIKRIIARYLKDPFEIMLSSGNVSVDQITHFYYVTSHMRKPQTLLTLLDYEEPDAAIVFTNTRDDANFIGGFLQKRGHDAEVLTGELTQSQRERVMAKIKAGNLRYLVATDVAARGIDINDLSHVINYNLPESPEVYVHRTGRTGRAGKSGIAAAIVSGLDISTLHHLTRFMKIRLEERPIPEEAEVRANRLDKVVKKLVGQVRGAIEEGKFADREDRHLQLAERVLSQPHAKEIVATLLERWLEPAAEAEALAATAKADRITAATAAGSRTVVANDVTVSPEQREFEERAGGRGGRGGRGGPGGGRDRERGGGRGAERGPRGAGGGRDRGPRGASSEASSERPAAATAERPASGRERGPRERRPERSADRPATPGVDVKTLMVTLGRRAGMGAREVGLFVVNNAGIDVNQVIDVRVRDGYSFVDVTPSVADAVIAGVSGKEHDGRVVKVELARKQRGEETAPATAAPAGEPAATPGTDKP